jgi:uncharacterized protein (DUF305 family)
MQTLIRRIAPLMVAITFGAAGALAHNPAGKPDPMNASLEKLKGAEFEQSFLQQMIQHHRSAIEMANMASGQTQRTELRQFAEKVISNQQKEIDEMTDWLQSWYNTSAKDIANTEADKEMKTHMSMFAGKKDADFDKTFLQMMPQHHHVGVEMAEQAEKKATHPELKAFASKLAKDEQAEIKQMKQWAQEWFGPA